MGKYPSEEDYHRTQDEQATAHQEQLAEEVATPAPDWQTIAERLAVAAHEAYVKLPMAKHNEDVIRGLRDALAAFNAAMKGVK
jgi:hypothetical protein